MFIVHVMNPTDGHALLIVNYVWYVPDLHMLSGLNDDITNKRTRQGSERVVEKAEKICENLTGYVGRWKSLRHRHIQIGDAQSPGPKRTLMPVWGGH